VPHQGVTDRPVLSLLTGAIDIVVMVMMMMIMMMMMMMMIMMMLMLIVMVMYFRGLTSAASSLLPTGAIDIVVVKAQEEVHFSAMYAELCRQLSATPLESLGEVDKVMTIAANDVQLFVCRT
jgi:hypothetical protein